MLPLPKKTRPPKDPKAEKLYAETETLQLPPPIASPKALQQKEITYPLTRRHRKLKGGYPHILAPPGITRVPPYFIDRCKEIAEQFEKINRHGKAKLYLDTCAFYDPKDTDTLYRQGINHSHFNEYNITLAKAEECLRANPADHKARLLKGDTLFRMCDFENALLCYSEGLKLKLPYRNGFMDGYYRTTALLYNITGKFPMFYGGNMRVFYRLVQGQERGKGLRIFNDTYKHYDELFPLEPNLTGLQEEINMFHVTKPRPPHHIERRIKKAAIQQLKGSKKILGGFWDYKLEVEKHLIKKEYAIPHCGPKDRTEYIERALQFLKNRIDRFEVVCVMMKNNELRKFSKRIDWLSQYGKWMAADKAPSVIPPAKTGGLATSRYRWALSQTLFDMRNKTLDVCWVRTLKRQTHKQYLFSQRRPWKYYCGYRSAKQGALAAIRISDDANWSFMQKLQDNVLRNLEPYAPPVGALLPPKHIRDIEKQIVEARQMLDSVAEAPQLVMPMSHSEQADKLYFDPESNIEQWDENRDMLRKAQLKREDRPGFLPPTPDDRPIPANLLEVFESRVHDAPDAWDNRRKLSRDLRESLAKAEAARAVHAMSEKRPLFAAQMAAGKQTGSAKNKPRDSHRTENAEVEDSDSFHSLAEAGSTVQATAEAAGRPPPAVSPDEEEFPAQEISKERKVRREGPRYKYDILEKKSEVDYLYKPRTKRRLEKKEEHEVVQVAEVTVEDENEKALAQLEAERLLAAKAEDPYEIAKRTFDNQKAMFLDRAYNTLMGSSKVAEFTELEAAIGDLLDSTFPPKNMRFPNGDPMILKGYPPPAALTKPPISEYFANRNKPKPKKKQAAAVAVDDAELADAEIPKEKKPSLKAHNSELTNEH